jgi:hypothetical protein
MGQTPIDDRNPPDRGTIARVERYLEEKFGDEYRRYKADVPRWL